jgi:hypothetical protein
MWFVIDFFACYWIGNVSLGLWRFFPWKNGTQLCYRQIDFFSELTQFVYSAFSGRYSSEGHRKTPLRVHDRFRQSLPGLPVCCVPRKYEALYSAGILRASLPARAGRYRSAYGMPCGYSPGDIPGTLSDAAPVRFEIYFPLDVSYDKIVMFLRRLWFFHLRRIAMGINDFKM